MDLTDLAQQAQAGLDHLRAAAHICLRRLGVSLTFHAMRSAFSATCLLGLSLCAGCDPWPEGMRVSQSGTSPDGRNQLEIVEITGRLRGRYFFRLRDADAGLGGGPTNTVDCFYAPNEGRPRPARILWTQDSSKVLVLGRHFLVHDRARLPDGQGLYVLYDLETGKLRCNGSRHAGYDAFTRADLEVLAWTEPIELRGPANRGRPIRPDSNQTPPAAGSHRSQ